MGQSSGTRVAEFVKGLHAICPSKHSDEVFRDSCELAFCALAKVASPWPDQREKLEAQYMEVVGRYRDKDAIRAMPPLLTRVLCEIGKGGIDFLGQVAGEIGALNSQMGQFFTPYEVSRLMAEISFDGVDQIIAENGFVTVQEPAAGAGGMLLAMADVIEAKGYNLETQVWIEATELSRSTFHMCYVQCAARGLAGRIINGNSLSGETYEVALTGAARVFYDANGDPFARQRAAHQAAKEQEAAREDAAESDVSKRLDALRDAPPIAGDQLSLF